MSTSGGPSGGGGGGGLLYSSNYGTTGGVQYDTGATTLTTIDSANLQLSFKAPSSGNVVVWLSATSYSAQYYWWGLVDASSNAQYGPVVLASAQSALVTVNIPIRVSGLTAGTTYTMNWAHCVSNSASHGGLWAVYVNNNRNPPGANPGSPATIVVSSA